MDPELGGGSILDVGCYTTSMAHLVAAAANNVPVVEALDVSGSAVIGPTRVDHSAAATLDLGGVLARVACSIQENLESVVTIVGSKGRITLSSPWLPGRIGSKATILLERWGADPEDIDFSNHRDVYMIEVDAVNDAIGKGERSTTMMSWDDSLANMRTLDRWRRSAGVRPAGGD
jgi:predicted dehydrogenase